MIALIAIALSAVSGFLIVDSLLDSRYKDHSRLRVLARIREPQDEYGARDKSRLLTSGIPDGSRAAELNRPALLGVLKHVGKQKKKTSDVVMMQLPEMEDVIALGMDGGMTFEAAFRKYAEKFDTYLAMRCRPASKVMSKGIRSRDDVLKELGEELSCQAFDRFVDTVSRSVRFGAQLAPLLSELADETRSSYQSRLEEEVAKAPTKMLIPTGVLILPAMLILIAGPFLVEILNQL